MLLRRGGLNYLYTPAPGLGPHSLTESLTLECGLFRDVFLPRAHCPSTRRLQPLDREAHVGKTACDLLLVRLRYHSLINYPHAIGRFRGLKSESDYPWFIWQTHGTGPRRSRAAAGLPQAPGRAAPTPSAPSAQHGELF